MTDRDDVRREAADYHVAAQRRAADREAQAAGALLADFVRRAEALGLPVTELAARPWSGRGGPYRTGVRGWYLRKDHSLGVGLDGAYYVLTVPPTRWGRWRRVPIERSAPSLQVGRGGRDGESMALAELIALRLTWPDVPAG